MFRLQDITFVQVKPTEKGIFAAAKYKDWFYEYNFFLDKEGRITGRTSNNYWEELSMESASIIKAKIQNFLATELPA